MDVHEVLRESGERWRRDQPAVPAYDIAALVSEAEPPTRRSAVRWWWPAYAAAATVAVVVLGSVALHRGTAPAGPPATDNGTSCTVGQLTVTASQFGVDLLNRSERPCTLAPGPDRVTMSGPSGTSVLGTFVPPPEPVAASGTGGTPPPASDRGKPVGRAIVLAPFASATATFLTVSTGACFTSGGGLNDNGQKPPIAYDTVALRAAQGLELRASLNPPVTRGCTLPTFVVSTTWSTSEPMYDACAAKTAQASATAAGDGFDVRILNTGASRCDPGPTVWSWKVSGDLGSHGVAYVPSLVTAGQAVSGTTTPGRVVLPGGSYYVHVVVQHPVTPCTLHRPGSVTAFDVELSGGFGTVHAALPAPVGVAACSQLASNDVWFTKG